MGLVSFSTRSVAWSLERSSLHLALGAQKRDLVIPIACTHVFRRIAGAAARLRNILQAYGMPVDGDVPALYLRLAAHLGLKPRLTA